MSPFDARLDTTKMIYVARDALLDESLGFRWTHDRDDLIDTVVKPIVPVVAGPHFVTDGGTSVGMSAADASGPDPRGRARSPGLYDRPRASSGAARPGRAMLNTFHRGITASTEVPGTARQVYDVVRDPDFVARSAPFVRRITPLADDVWRWEIGGIRYPGGTFTAGFTQRMTFDPPHEIAFRHDPHAGDAGPGSRRGHQELAGAEGLFRTTGAERADHVRLELEMRVEARVPAPRAAAAVVEGAIGAVLAVIRDRFVEALQHRMAQR